MNLSQRALLSVHVWHPWPLTSHQIRKNSEEIEKTLSQGKKWRNLQESNRGGSLSRMERRIDVMWPEGIIRVTTRSMNMTECIIVGSRHGPQSRPPWSIRQMEVERRSGRGLSRATPSDPARSNGPLTSHPSILDEFPGSLVLLLACLFETPLSRGSSWVLPASGSQLSLLVAFQWIARFGLFYLIKPWSV